MDKLIVNGLDVRDMSEENYKESLTDKNTVHEKKWDGTLCEVSSDGKGHIELWGRGTLKDGTQSNFTKQFPEVIDALKKTVYNVKAKFLCELVIIDKNTGHEKFSLLQTRAKRLENIEEYAKKIPARIIMFDLLYFYNKDYSNLPFYERRFYLEQFRDNYNYDRKFIRVISQKRTEKGKRRLWKKIKKQKLEGVCVKYWNSVYGEGVYKNKRHQTEDVFVQSGSEGTGRLKKMGVFGALSMYQYVDGHQKYCGNVGSGFNDEMRKEIQKLLFLNTNGSFGLRDLKHEPFVIEVKLDSITNDGIFRHPRFMRIRFDKTKEMCVRKN